MNKILKAIKVRVRYRAIAGSERFALLNIHIPVNMNINTAERAPISLIISPMWGTAIANIKEKENHPVTIA